MPRRRGLTITELLVALFVVAILLAILIPAVQMAREASRRTACAGNLKQLQLTALTFAGQRRNHLPGWAAAMFDAKQRPATSGVECEWESLSWRATLLPNQEQQALFDKINLRMSALSAANLPIGQTLLSIYQCPSTPGFPRRVESIGGTGNEGPRLHQGVDLAARDYRAVFFVVQQMSATGVWGAKAQRTSRSLSGTTDSARLDDTTDGTSNTISLVESAGAPTLVKDGNQLSGASPGDGPWLSPEWVPLGAQSVNKDSIGAIFSYHPHTATIAMADGSVHYLGENIAGGVLLALMTRDGGEPVDAKAWQ